MVRNLLTREWLIPFILVTTLFPLWGFANDLTNPLVRVFKDLFLISNFQSSLVQFAFYLGYGLMAIPAAIFIRVYSYKAGIVLGLLFYAIGAFLFIPASSYAVFNYFLVALCVITCGLAFLEVTANPYILSMGDKVSATRRLNLAQAFNPLGSLTGMFVASSYILNELKIEEFRQAQLIENPSFQQLLPSEVDGLLTKALSELKINTPDMFYSIQTQDLETVRTPYVFIGITVLVLALLFIIFKFPHSTNKNIDNSPIALLKEYKNLLQNKIYREGVIAQGFYVGAQIMCWTFIIHYAIQTLGLSASTAQNLNILAMCLFIFGRFLCTILLFKFDPRVLLLAFSIFGTASCIGTVFLPGSLGLGSLILTSGFMSLMFPSIYGIALGNMRSETASLASAGLVMAIVGGALLPPIQGYLIDIGPIIGDIPSVKSSFLLPAFCLLVVGLYAFRCLRVHERKTRAFS